MLVDFTHPLRNLSERIAVSDIVSDNDTVRTLVVAGGDGLESLLASSIPDLELNGLAVDVDGSDLEIDTDGGHEVLVEHVVSETEEEGGLSDTRVSNEEDLEEIIAVQQHR
eukprot:CAMPEP_0170478604 /NCGR_PEP_ID=MMETSP0208-20121228/73_1 /TAXON_ID=197538 /ORGANISM="Strombidium inclinatum, Strain S3" /LENGTH=110 /DNA_ID=CAMNT_0010750893 /DNA_START=364 /DNA_END=696 /DNA_ORIENTATION=+